MATLQDEPTPSFSCFLTCTRPLEEAIVGHRHARASATIEMSGDPEELHPNPPAPSQWTSCFCDWVKVEIVVLTLEPARPPQLWRRHNTRSGACYGCKISALAAAQCPLWRPSEMAQYPLWRRPILLWMQNRPGQNMAGRFCKSAPGPGRPILNCDSGPSPANPKPFQNPTLQ